MTDSNNPPDVVLELTHEQATFMLENCKANMRLAFAMVMALAEEDVPIEEKRRRAEPMEKLRTQFANMSTQLRKAGAKDKEEPEDE